MIREENFFISTTKPLSEKLNSDFTDAELEAYLDEALDPDRAAELEDKVRSDKQLLGRMSHINGRRDAGIHTLGEIWRRNQIGVPTAEDMANYMLDVLPAEQSDYIRFRIEQLRCPFTIAMWKDLKEKEGESEEATKSKTRQRKYFNSSAGLLKKKDGKS